MQAEADEIPDGDALEFALGCMFAAVRERTLTMDSAIKSVRFGAVAVMVAIALMGARSAWRITAVNPPTALVFVVSSAVFGAAALWTLFRGPVALVQAATMMLLVYACALAFLHLTGSVTGWTNLELYRALAVEGLMIWSALLAAGLFLWNARRRSTATC